MAVKWTPGGWVTVPDKSPGSIPSVLIPRRSGRGGGGSSGRGGGGSSGGGSSPARTPSVIINPVGGGAEVIIDGQGSSVLPGQVESFLKTKGLTGSSYNEAIQKAKSIDAVFRTEQAAKEAVKQKQIQLAIENQRRIDEIRNKLIREGARVNEVVTKDNKGNIIRKEEIIRRGNQEIRFYKDYITGNTYIRELESGRLTSLTSGKDATQSEIKKELIENNLTPIIKDGVVVGFRSNETRRTYTYTEGGFNQYNKDVQRSGVRFNRAVNEIMSSRMTTIDKTTKFVRKYFNKLDIDTQNRIVNFVRNPLTEVEISLRNKIKKLGGRNALEIFDKIADKITIVPRRLSTRLSYAGDFAISSGEKIAAYSRRLKPESFGKYGFGTQKGLQFLLGAGSEITKVTGGFLKLPALTISVLENPVIIPFLSIQIIGGVINDLTRIKNIRSADATSLGSGTITALLYLLPVVRGGKAIIKKVIGRKGAKLTPAEINKIKYAASKTLKTLETTLKQKGAKTKISGVGLATTRTQTISQSKYTGLMKIAKRKAVVLQTSSVRLSSGASYNSISQIAMKFGNKLIPAIKKVGKDFITFKSNGRIIKIPFSKIKYQARELIGWVIDSKGGVTANIFGKTMKFRNQAKFIKYINSKHGIKVIKGLYLNPKIKNIPTIKGVSYAYQKGMIKTTRGGVGVKIYRTTRGTYRSKTFRKKAGGIAIEFTKPTKIKSISKRLIKKYKGLPKLKATIRNAREIKKIKLKIARFERAKAIQRAKTIQKAKTIQRAKTIQSSQAKFIPKLTSKMFNRFIKNNLAARTIQKSLIKGATITLLGTAIVARTATGQIRSLKQLSRMNTRQLNREVLKMRQGLIQSTSQITRTITRPTSITRQLTKPPSSSIGSPGIRPPKIIPEEKIPPIPRILLGNFYNKNLSKAVPVYQVVEKIRGNYRKLSPSSLSLKDARDYAVYSIDNRLSKTAFFVPTGKSKTINIPPKQIQNYSSRNIFKVRPYRIRFGKKRQLVNGFIEKRRFFNDTPGERGSLRRLRKISPQQRRVLLSRLKKAREIRMRMLRRRR